MRPFLKTKIAVLSELMGARDLAVSGEALGLSLGLTRQAVWKAVKALKEDGYVIESMRKGYRFVHPENDLDPSLSRPFCWTALGDTPSFIGRASTHQCRQGTGS